MGGWGGAEEQGLLLGGDWAGNLELWPGNGEAWWLGTWNCVWSGSRGSFGGGPW